MHRTQVERTPGFAVGETVRGALHGGAVHYLVKPFDARTLRETAAGAGSREPELPKG